MTVDMGWDIRGEVEHVKEIERRAKALVESFVRERLAGEVRRVSVGLAPDHDGEAALFIDLFIDDDEDPPPQKVRRFADATSELQSIVLREFDGLFPYVHLREAA